jgi:hypothetical protein
MENSENKGLFTTPKNRYEYNIKTDKQLGYGVVDWIHLAVDRVQCIFIENLLMDLLSSIKSGEFLYNFVNISFSKKSATCSLLTHVILLESDCTSWTAVNVQI